MLKSSGIIWFFPTEIRLNLTSTMIFLSAVFSFFADLAEENAIDSPIESHEADTN